MNAHRLLLDNLLVCLVNGIRRSGMGLFVYLGFAGAPECEYNVPS